MDFRIESVFTTEWINTSPNISYPQSFLKFIKGSRERERLEFGIEIRLYDEFQNFKNLKILKVLKVFDN